MLIVYLDHNEYYINNTSVKADIDGNKYSVLSQYDDKDKAANIIASVDKFADKLINKLNDVYIIKPQPATKDYKIGKLITSRIIIRYDDDNLIENEPRSKELTSYTKNKGDIIALCIREKLSGKNKIHDINDIIFVFIHELAHVGSVSITHDEEFWTNFKFLMEFCKKYGLFEPVDYKKNPIVYCGLQITHNPYFDDGIYSYFKP